MGAKHALDSLQKDVHLNGGHNCYGTFVSFTVMLTKLSGVPGKPLCKHI